MKKIKTFLLILIIFISFSNIAYAVPKDYSGKWIEASYTNYEGLKDNSHWVLDESFLTENSLSESDIVSLHLTGYTNFKESHYTTSYFPGMSFVCGSGECKGFYEWTHTFEANGRTITINYLRYYEAKGDTGCIISFAGPPCIYVTEGVRYSDFRVGVEETPGGEITTYTPEQIGEWVEEVETIEATHGTITVSKEPTYVFTKWHRLNDGTPAGMDLTISWNATKGFQNIEVKMIVVRYIEDEEEKYEIFDIYEGSADLSGIIEKTGDDNLKFEHAGYIEFDDFTKGSHLYIKFTTEEGNIGEIIAPIPINGFFGINISEPVSVKGIFEKSALDVETFNF